MKVEYFTIEGAPGKYFMCAPYRTSMSVAACASMFVAERAAGNCGRHVNCKGCPVGRFHAGEQPAAAPGLATSLLCPRCHKLGSRLVRGVCISCLNRQYEVERGLNARGKTPVRLRRLAPMALTVRCDSGPAVVEAAMCSGRMELILRTAKLHQDVRYFGRKPKGRVFSDKNGRNGGFRRVMV